MPGYDPDFRLPGRALAAFTSRHASEIMAGADAFNALADDAARHALRRCCSPDAWVAAMAAGQPDRALDALLARPDAAAAHPLQPHLPATPPRHPQTRRP